MPTLTTPQAAHLLKCTPRWLQKLVDEGHIERRGRGRYAIVPVVHGGLDYLKDEQRRTSKSAAASRVQDARAREYELKNAEREARLVDINEHQELFVEVFGTLKASLYGVPARASKDIAIRRVIEKAIEEALVEASNRFERLTAELAGTDGR
ncbi:MAG: hypothetical protein Q8K85_11835 [Hyphomicrobium sp.]|nr:hypothetical protein [Hyphomicrobium sp.]